MSNQLTQINAEMIVPRFLNLAWLELCRFVGNDEVTGSLDFSSGGADTTVMEGLPDMRIARAKFATKPQGLWGVQFEASVMFAGRDLEPIQRYCTGERPMPLRLSPKIVLVTSDGENFNITKAGGYGKFMHHAAQMGGRP